MGVQDKIKEGHIYISKPYGRVRVWGFYRHAVSREAGVLFRPVSKIQSGPQHQALSLDQWAEAEFVEGEYVVPSIYELPHPERIITGFGKKKREGL